MIYQVLSSDATQGDAWNDLLFTRSYIYRISICFLLQIGMQFTGILLVTTLGHKLLEELSMHNVYLGISLGILSSIFGVIFGITYIDIWGRRYIMICGAVGISITWLAMALCVMYGGLLTNKPEIFYSSYLLRFLFGSLLCSFGFIFSFSFGLVSYIIPVEMFPMRLRSKASSVNIIFQSIMNMLGIIFLEIYFNQNWSIGGLFSFYGFMSIAMGILMWICLPETKGM